MRTLTTCPHCRAIIDDSPFCTICGKSPREVVDPHGPQPELPPPTDVDRARLVRLAGSTIAIIAVVALIWAWTHDPETVYVAPPLPEPTPTEPTIPTDGRAPSVEAPVGRPVARPFSALAEDPAANDGRAPWEDAPASHVATGAPLGDADYTAARAQVAALLAAVPGPWTLEGPVDGGPVDLTAAEDTQPFAARTLGHPEHGRIGEVWLVASLPDDPVGAAYVADTRVSIDREVAETVSPRPGIRLMHVAGEPTSLWFADIATPSLVRFFVAADTDPAVLATFLEDWQFATLDPVA